MALYESMLVAECTEEEIETISADEEFAKSIKLHQALEEYELLTKFNSALKIQAVYGKTGAIEKKLEKINPERWSKKTEERAPIDLSNITVVLKGKHPDGNNDGS